MSVDIIMARNGHKVAARRAVEIQEVTECMNEFQITSHPPTIPLWWRVQQAHPELMGRDFSYWSRVSFTEIRLGRAQVGEPRRDCIFWPGSS